MAVIAPPALQSCPACSSCFAVLSYLPPLLHRLVALAFPACARSSCFTVLGCPLLLFQSRRACSLCGPPASWSCCACSSCFTVLLCLLLPLHSFATRAIPVYACSSCFTFLVCPRFLLHSPVGPPALRPSCFTVLLCLLLLL